MYLVDTHEADALESFVIGTITTFEVAADTTLTTDTATYTFSFQAENSLPIGAILTITLPDEVVLPNGSIDCNIAGATPSCTVTDQVITVNDAVAAVIDAGVTTDLINVIVPQNP